MHICKGGLSKRGGPLWHVGKDISAVHGYWLLARPVHRHYLLDETAVFKPYCDFDQNDDRSIAISSRP